MQKSLILGLSVALFGLASTSVLASPVNVGILPPGIHVVPATPSSGNPVVLPGLPFNGARQPGIGILPPGIHVIPAGQPQSPRIGGRQPGIGILPPGIHVLPVGQPQPPFNGARQPGVGILPPAPPPATAVQN